MNIFRAIGDFCHFLSIIMIIRRVHIMRSCRGLSLKSRVLYAMVFLTRYVDLAFRFVSYYNTFMKVYYIGTSLYIIYLLTYKFRAMDDEVSTDTFPILYVLVPCVILALVFNYKFSVMEILWSFSIFLEAVAVLPQLHMLQRTGQAEALTRYYILCLGLYRAFYIPNWIYRYFVDNVLDPLAFTAGVVQTVLNFYFIAVYLAKYPKEADVEALEHTRSHAGVLPPDVVPQLNPSIILPGQDVPVQRDERVPLPAVQDVKATTEPAALAKQAPLVDASEEASPSLSFPAQQTEARSSPQQSAPPTPPVEAKEQN